MKLNIISTLIVATAIFLCGCSKQIDGQIFVSTVGGTSYKLGSVQIAIVSAENLKPAINQYIEEAQKLQSENKAQVKKMVEVSDASEGPLVTELQRIQAERYIKAAVVEAALSQIVFDQTNIARIYGITPLVTTSTDADGKFNIKATGLNCYLLARAGRAISSEKSERYYWIVKLSNDNIQTIMLNNINQIELEFTLDDIDKTITDLQALIK